MEVTHTPEAIAAMIERLDHMSKNTRDEYLHELAGRSSAMLRDVAAERDALAATCADFALVRLERDKWRIKYKALSGRHNYVSERAREVHNALMAVESERDQVLQDEPVKRRDYLTEIKILRAAKGRAEAERDRLAAMVEKLTDLLKRSIVASENIGIFPDLSRQIRGFFNNSAASAPSHKDDI